jgi:hypothetical protein
MISGLRANHLELNQRHWPMIMLYGVVCSRITPSTAMRKPVRFLLPLWACLLSGCATPHWVKPEASKSDLAQDRAACVQAVQQPPPSGTTDQQQYEACMNAHGWKLLQ